MGVAICCCRRQARGAPGQYEEGEQVQEETLTIPVPKAPRLDWAGNRLLISPSGITRRVLRTADEDLARFE